jgi:hypothetical protein
LPWDAKILIFLNVSLIQEDYQVPACWQHFFDLMSWRTPSVTLVSPAVRGG